MNNSLRMLFGIGVAYLASVYVDPAVDVWKVVAGCFLLGVGARGWDKR